MRIIKYCFAITVLLLLAVAPVMAGDATPVTVKSLLKDMASLKGKQVSFSGKVVKVNNGIMKRNFVHVSDGADKVIVTSNQTANVGQSVSIVGEVALDTDFGMGYSYPLLVEKSSITVK